MDKQYDILTAQRNLLGEGALWDDRSQTFWWTDILASNIYQLDPISGDLATHQIGSHVGTIGLRKQGGFMLATATGFVTFDPRQGVQKWLQSPESHPDDHRFNDGKPGPAGEFWAGTIAYDAAAGAASLYRLGVDQQSERIVQNLTISNGMAWNSAENTFYFIDTPSMQIVAYDYDKTTGNIANPRPVVTIPDAAGFPDGMTIDENDKLWVAHYGGSAVRCWDPDSGQQVAAIDLPATQITCCTFGGPNFDHLYVTSASQGLNSAELKAQPLAGAQFRVAMPVSGRPAYRYAG